MKYVILLSLLPTFVWAYTYDCPDSIICTTSSDTAPQCDDSQYHDQMMVGSYSNLSVANGITFGFGTAQVNKLRTPYIGTCQYYDWNSKAQINLIFNPSKIKFYDANTNERLNKWKRMGGIANKWDCLSVNNGSVCEFYINP